MAPPITCSCGACNKCKWREYMRGWYRRNAETARELAKRSRAGRAEAARAYDSARAAERKKKANPMMLRAHGWVWRALRDGRLVRQPCEVCGATEVQAHHDDYEKPLEVRWLCRAHHMELHRTVAS